MGGCGVRRGERGRAAADVAGRGRAADIDGRVERVLERVHLRYMKSCVLL